MNEAVTKELQERLDFAEKIKVYPYEEVKKTLDAAARKTAKEAVEDFRGLFEPIAEGS